MLINTRELYRSMGYEEELNSAIKAIKEGNKNHPGETSGDITFKRMKNYIADVYNNILILGEKDISKINCIPEMSVNSSNMDDFVKEVMFFFILWKSCYRRRKRFWMC